MSFHSDFERAFIRRSLLLVKSYNGPYDATILLNCLLGLMIVPCESALINIPGDQLEDMDKWGISPDSIVCFGNFNEKNYPHNLSGFVRHLRNAITHNRFKPVPEYGEVKAFVFTDKSGFKAEINLDQLRNFTEILATKLIDM